MLYYASNSGPNVAYSSSIREAWTKVVDEALSKGGVAEACWPLCLHLDKAALERLESGAESIGDEDVARALLAASSKGATEPALLNAYDHLLSKNGAVSQSPKLRLHLLRSVLVILHQWAMSLFAHRMSTSAYRPSIILDAAKRYMSEVSEVQRLDLPQMHQQTEAVYSGFQEIEESLRHKSPLRVTDQVLISCF
ncbi:hypothetical protein RchiOBHm_Chr2g0167021 [Rosa chinensis]|uniref:Uncharacterized protein n=1 Tax=Rosa chinensis TaxID=74649 RepID=A0A2P6S476_ROSCH|nr:hypothetical protein RchiOBHm_Chr2g0167021 [Rosa chinensis]